MPSTFVHLGFGALLATALLSEHFDWRALSVVLIIVALPDLDTVLGLWMDGAHRAVLHNVWVVLVPAVVLTWDIHLRERSYVRERWGARGVRIGWVSLVSLAIAHIALDAFYNGVNLFWPVYDAFIDLNGQLIYSSEEGLVQTFVELGDDGSTVRGTTDDVHYRTGVDPGDHPVREFHLIQRAELFVIALGGFAAAGYRLYEEHGLGR